MNKPRIYSDGEGGWCCSMFIKGRPMHGYGATMREAYFDWCVKVFGAPHPVAE